MRWPWHKIETRNSYTETLTAAIQASATGATLAIPGSTAAIEMCSGLVARSFSLAEVSGPDYVREALTPSVLALIGRNLVRDGQVVLRIDVSGGMIRLVPASACNIEGGSDPATWTYTVTEQGPGQAAATWRVPGAAVVHIMYARDVARLSASLALLLGDEAGGPVGRVLPIPRTDGQPNTEDGELDPVELMRRDLAGLRGGLAVVESMADSWQAGNVGRGPADWEEKRLGANPPQALVTLHEIATREVLAAFGLNPALFSASDGTASREGWRQALHGLMVQDDAS